MTETRERERERERDKARHWLQQLRSGACSIREASGAIA